MATNDTALSVLSVTVRSQTLYPAELRAHACNLTITETVRTGERPSSLFFDHA